MERFSVWLKILFYYKNISTHFKKHIKKIYFPLLGIGSLIWFLIRVIPKPSRAAYPCMKVAAPMASSFVLWILGLAASLGAFKKMKLSFNNSSYIKASIFLVIGIGFGLFAISQNGFQSISAAKSDGTFTQANLAQNDPMGDAVGVFPGRVVWVHNPDATNENCDPDEVGNSYFEPKNNDQNVIDGMVSQAIQGLTGEASDNTAWEKIFKFHNAKRGKGETNYQDGEKIFLKLNITSSWYGNFSPSDLSKRENGSYGLSETSPAFILAILRQLVNVVGVDETNIYMGDPMKHIYKHSYEYFHAEFPNVHYLDHDGYENLGRELAEKGTAPLIKYSDRGSVLVQNSQPIYEDKLYKIFEDMDYMLNLPQMKGHIRGGVTMFAKNHFGSHIRDGANHLHNGLIDPGETGLSKRPGFGLYRVQVDIMGHEILGGKNLFYIMDALWGTHHELASPHKWQIPPFNNDWTSSIFASFDPVAIESVGYDFVRSEFNYDRYPEGFDFYNGDPLQTIQAEGVCDYLRQAADSSNWPDGIEYDPEEDGTIISSLGAHEHWNDPINKEYSRNLETGEGIELLKINTPLSILATPTSLEASIVNESEVQLTWSDNSSNEDGFIIERKPNIDNSVYIVIDTVTANETAYIDSSQKLYSDYYYKLAAFNTDKKSDYTDEILVENLVIVSIEEDAISNDYELHQNYPNPFNPTTNISFSLKNKADVKLEVYDALGNLIKVLMDEKLNEGFYNTVWDSKNQLGSKVGSGTYFYRVSIFSNGQSFSQSKKMVLVK